jgi:hypothetical protein
MMAQATCAEGRIRVMFFSIPGVTRMRFSAPNGGSLQTPRRERFQVRILAGPFSNAGPVAQRQSVQTWLKRLARRAAFASRNRIRMGLAPNGGSLQTRTGSIPVGRKAIV